MRIARQALDATRKNADLHRADKAMLQTFANMIGRDLVATLMVTLKCPLGPTAELASLVDPFCGCGGIEIDFDCPPAMAPVRVAIPAWMIVVLRKSYIGSPARQVPDASSVANALGGETLAFEAILGAATMSISELQALDIGDVIVLDTMLKDTIPFVSEKSKQKLGEAVVAQHDGRVRLMASAAQGA
jgi:Type III flagellar switch regulator (C-ring) FliN C-term